MLTIGAVANLKFYGLAAAAIYSLIVGLAIYLFTYNIHCVIHGRCYTTAWFNMLIGLGTLVGVLTYYIIALQNGQLPDLIDQNLLRLIPFAGQSVNYLEKNYDIHLANYLPNASK